MRSTFITSLNDQHCELGIQRLCKRKKCSNKSELGFSEPITATVITPKRYQSITQDVF